MKYTVCIILFILPLPLLSQSNQDQIESDVILKNNYQEPSPLDLITPVLLRTTDSDFNNEYHPSSSGFWNHSAAHFFSSLIIPGSAQIANRNWKRAGLFIAVEALSIYMIVDYRNRGISGERKYEQYADNNWSVVQYSEWLIDYHNFHGLNNQYLSELRNMVEGNQPAFTPDEDWSVVALETLRQVERNTLYVTTDDLGANNFSHVLPDYGSQQYYELIAKYYQYQAGWKDYDSFHNSLGHTDEQYFERYFIDRNGEYASPMFYKGVELADRFNNDFRRSRVFTSLLIANHFISAFDSYFTFKLKQNRLQAASSIMPGRQIIVNYTF